MPIKKLNVNDTLTAFKSKSDKDLKRSTFLFRFMQNAAIVKLFSKLMVFSINVGLPIKRVIRNTIFRQFCGGESIEESRNVINQLKNSRVGSILDYSVESKENENDFESTKNEIIRIITLAALERAIPYTSIKLTGICSVDLLEKIGSKEPLTDNENAANETLKRRLEEIFDHCKKNDVAIYIDAEESWLQDAIDELAEYYMKKYNHTKAIVLTTLQMYRWDRLEYLENLIKDARANRYLIGIKLVRGAYMEKENLRAKEQKYKSPIQPSKRKTDDDFNQAVEICLRNIDIITLCAGTHNEESTIFLVEKMKELNLPKDHKNIYFSQLYGMSDHLTFNLADSGYNVTKYLPYGPIKSVIPYLVRRAEENSAISGQMGRELKLLITESERRKIAGLLPQGDSKRN